MRPETPALDLTAMPVADLARLMDVSMAMIELSRSFMNQPRFAKTPAGSFVEDLHDAYFGAMAEAIHDELIRRTTTNADDAEDKGQALLQYLAHGDDFHGMLRICSEAIQGMSVRAA